MAKTDNDSDAARKPILAVEQQIEHLKGKGVAFELCSEAEAARYLSEKCNFFKLASYRKLFAKHEGGARDGMYISLDFAQLRLLASIDQQLRRVLLEMTLDIEHFQKVAILREAEKRGEDGYAIVADYMNSLSESSREYRLRELKMSGLSPYSADVYAKYAADLPVWAFFELTSFGTLVDFVRFCAKRWDDRDLLVAHYDLKGVKSLRNGAAHGSCIVNAFAERGAGRASVTNSVMKAAGASGASKATRAKWMGCPAIQQIATAIVVYSRIVPAGRSRSRTAADLADLFGRIEANSALLPSNGPNSTAWAALGFARALTMGLGLVE